MEHETAQPVHIREGALFRIVWEPAGVESASPSPSGPCLIVADESGVGSHLCDRIRAAGREVTLVHASDDLQASARKGLWEDVVFLSALDVPPADQLTPESLQQSERMLCSAALDLVHGLAATPSAPRLWLITRNSQDVAGSGNPGIVQALLWGFAQSIFDEYPEWKCTCIDLGAHDPQTAAAQIFDESPADAGKELLAFRGNDRYVMRIVPEVVSAEPISILADATYLITGGFGGLGRHVARWLIQHGARNLVLSGRTTPSSIMDELSEFAKPHGARLVPWKADVSRYSDAARMISEIQANLPPLRGVLHAAGVLEDATLREQTWEKFDRVLAPKVLGSWNLHSLTISIPLDFFILFSSIAAVVGAPGQANYGAANAFEDALAIHRCQRGLPATSIAWGAWSEGMAAREGLEKRRAGIGIYTLNPEQSLPLLEQALQSTAAHVLAGSFNWDQFVTRYQSRPVPGRFCRLVAASELRPVPSRERELRRQLDGLTQAAGTVVVRKYLQSLAVRVLGFSPDRTIDPAQPLQELGLDSLMSLELRNALSDALGQNLPATLLFSHPALDDLAAFVIGLRWNSEPATSKVEFGSKDLLDELENLSDEQLDRLLSAKFGLSQ